jgi:hypothetical protein
MFWKLPLRHNVHEVIEPLFALRVTIIRLDLVLLGKLFELAALESFFEVHRVKASAGVPMISLLSW